VIYSSQWNFRTTPWTFGGKCHAVTEQATTDAEQLSSNLEASDIPVKVKVLYTSEIIELFIMVTVSPYTDTLHGDDIFIITSVVVELFLFSSARI